jgi:hypothetical protein
MGFYTAEGLTTIASRFLGLHWWKMASSRGETLDEAKAFTGKPTRSSLVSPWVSEFHMRDRQFLKKLIRSGSV